MRQQPRFARSLVRMLLLAALALALPLIASAPASANHEQMDGQSYLFLQPGFTQDVYGVSFGFMGGVAFAPDGDPWVSPCVFSGGALRRFDAQGTAPEVNSTETHPESVVASNSGCGIVNHPNGFMYSNTSAGASKIDAATGVYTGVTQGPGGNALGITVDPVTKNVVYVHADCRSTGTCTIVTLDPATGTSSNFAVLPGSVANFIDGIQFDPKGDYLFLSIRSPSFRLGVLDRTGAVVQLVPMTSEPDGISFHATAPKFVITNNTDGTITRFDFPGDNYALPPTQSVFASGGFRGDLSQVGPDGCVYITQGGTRYDNGVVSGQNSLVIICGGFAPGPGVGPGPPANLVLEPETDTNRAGEEHCVTATVPDADGNPRPGITVRFSVSGGSAVTDANGQATFCYTGTNAGTDTIRAFADTDNDGVQDPDEPSDRATKIYVAGPPATLVLTPATDTNPVGDRHCVTATVRDAFGNPVPGATVDFTTTGGATPPSGTATTNDDGQAEFCFTGPALPGTVVITATVRGTTVSGMATKVFVLSGSTEGCKVTYGGRITAANGDKATFGGNAKADGLKGNENYQDHGPATEMHVKSSSILAVVCSSDGTSASIFGTATVDGAGSFDFRIDVRDLGEPGSADRYRIRLSNGYDSGDQQLEGGNIQIH